MFCDLKTENHTEETEPLFSPPSHRGGSEASEAKGLIRIV